MREKKELFLTIKLWVINIHGKKEIEKHQNVFSKIFTNYERKKRKFTVVKCSDTNLTKWSRSTSLAIKTNQYHEPLVQCTEKDTSFLWYSCQKRIASFHSQGNTRETHVFDEIFGKSPDQYSSKCQGHERQENTEERLQNYFSLFLYGEITNLPCGISFLDKMLELKDKVSGKMGEIQVRSAA